MSETKTYRFTTINELLEAVPKHETWAGPCGATVLGGLDLCRDHAKTPLGATAALHGRARRLARLAAFTA